MARLPYATRDDFPEELKYLWDRSETRPNVFLEAGNNPYMLRALLRFMNDVWRHTGVDPAMLEVAILRISFLKDHPYEWHQHVRLGLAAGLSRQRILAVKDWRRHEDLFSEQERAMLAYIDELAKGDHTSPEAFAAIRNHFDGSTVVGITFLFGSYLMTGVFFVSLEVETEEPFVGWDLEKAPA